VAFFSRVCFDTGQHEAIIIIDDARADITTITGK
jgi:hypothetical protein